MWTILRVVNDYFVLLWYILLSLPFGPTITFNLGLGLISTSSKVLRCRYIGKLFQIMVYLHQIRYTDEFSTNSQKVMQMKFINCSFRKVPRTRANTIPHAGFSFHLLSASACLRGSSNGVGSLQPTGWLFEQVGTFRHGFTFALVHFFTVL